MSSACTPHRLVGRRVRRKLASCFFARRIQLEKKTDAYSSRSPATSNGSIIFDFAGAGSRHKPTEKENRVKSVQTSPSHSNRINGEPHSVEEDYLVFCFGEDGAIDIINDTNDKDNHEEHEATASNKIDERKEIKNGDFEEEDRSKMDQFESCESNLSDTSSGSFAFPILKIEEWIGSPVHMPNNHGNQSVRVNCWRF